MSESRLGHVVNLMNCSHQNSLADRRRKPDDDQWLTLSSAAWLIRSVLQPLSVFIPIFQQISILHCLMPPRKLSGIRGECKCG